MDKALCTNRNKIKQVASNDIKEEQFSVLYINVEFPGGGWRTGQVNGQLNSSVCNFAKCHLMALKLKKKKLLLVYEKTLCSVF